MNGTLAGRTAVVTGAGQGLGRAIAAALHGSGANVLVTDVDAAAAAAAADAIDSTADRAAAVELDVRRRDDFERAFSDAAAHWGPVDILVNNAALTIVRPFWEITDDEWDEVVAVNLRGTFVGCQVAARIMRDHGFGRIVNLASAAGQAGRSVPGLHYAASKAGIVGLTRIVAAELAPLGITVNAVAPAAIDGPNIAALPPDRRDALRAGVPVGRFGRPEEVAALVVFLSSEDAGYITGATYDVNGGILMR